MTPVRLGTFLRLRFLKIGGEALHREACVRRDEIHARAHAAPVDRNQGRNGSILDMLNQIGHSDFSLHGVILACLQS